jgi:hypothetical protein
MFCKQCGSKLNDGVKFCPHCGTAQDIAPEAPTAQDPGTPEMPNANFNGAGNHYQTPNPPPQAPFSQQALENWENKEFNFYKSKGFFRFEYKIIYTDVVINGTNVDINQYNRTFFIKNGAKHYNFDISSVYNIELKKKLLIRTFLYIALDLVGAVLCINGDQVVFGLVLAILGILIFFNRYDEYVNIVYNGGEVNIYGMHTGHEDDLHKIKNYFIAHNRTMRVSDKF